ncbi:type VII secretion-associated serine protease mycosin [Cryptosporangium aurantiacum]|uniref:Type VII secretion-associated serine protease mycosin n=1 Tax=Cryptosporangium aurantiacum TaxID=134849 RepID=A0A1M7NID7_9ACTN|nr:type VII secretion-associated serine protease mycosin [Cryptosporangium aurantiacum]SHN03004.1 type VII secretion-associated serine protease mycosin [Cryptosporangium aurantiacum]
MRDRTAERRFVLPRTRRRLLAGLLATLTFAGTVVPGAAPAAADTVRDQQWQLSFLQATSAWQYSTGRGVTVAVIDSGVDATHPDLVGQVLPGTDFVDGTTDGRTDVVGHGTAVAAFIAGRNDEDGVVGLAPRTKILPIRVLDPRNEYDSAATIAKAVRWAVDRGVEVINLSLGSADTAKVLSDAIAYAFSKDVVVVACDGNLSNDRGAKVWHPAREPGVVAVSGVLRTGGFWTGSLQGPETVLAAPSTELTAAGLDHGYWRVQGTSFGAPMVSATAALIRSRYPDLTAANVVNRLISTADDEGTPGRDSQYGFGIVDPVGALSEPVPAVNRNPLLSSPATNQGGSAPSASPAPTVPSADHSAVKAPGPAVPAAESSEPALASRISALRSRALVFGWAIAAALILGLATVGFVLVNQRPRTGRRGWDLPPDDRGGPPPPPHW